MELEKVISKTSFPMSKEILIRDLRSIGLIQDGVVLVHCSLSSLGWVPGGTQAVLEALVQALDQGTLVMPAHTTHLTDPSNWKAPAVPEAWWPVIRGTLPVFDKDLTPVYGLGDIPEAFRAWKGTIRSDHPHYSFCARGPQAQTILESQSLSFSMGKGSPLDWLFKLNAQVLFLGTFWSTCTCFHLAEYLSGAVAEGPHFAPANVDGQRKWVEYLDLDFDSDCFEEIGLNFEKTGKVKLGTVGNAPAKLFFLKDAVEFATEYMTKDKTSGKLDIR